MAAKAVSTAVLFVGMAVLVGSASAQSTSGCVQALISISPCLSFLTGNETAPSRSCCSHLAVLTASQPECVCVMINSDELGIKVYKTLAQHLPNACCIKTPSICDIHVRTPSSGTLAGQTPTSAATGSKSMPNGVGNGDASLHGSAGFIVDPAVYAVADQ